jgi:hypothetical protein
VLAGLTDGAPLAIGLDALTFFVSAVTLLFLHIPSPKQSEETAGAPAKTLLTDVRETLDELRTAGVHPLHLAR